MSKTASRRQLVFLGIPVLVLIFVSIALTAFLAVNLMIKGIHDGLIGHILLGGLLGSMWIFMLLKTIKARRG